LSQKASGLQNSSTQLRTIALGDSSADGGMKSGSWDAAGSASITPPAPAPLGE
jgi:hypothetical protein